MSAGGASAQDDVYGFTHRQLRGDGVLVARVTGLGGVASALAGLSIRASLTPGAAQLSLLRSTSGTLVIRRRAQTNGAVTQTTAALTPATWLRLERRGQTISFSQSADGTQWASLHSATIDLSETAFVGLAVTSQRPDAMAAATMSNVQLDSRSSLPSGWSKVDLGGVSSQVQLSQSTLIIAQWASGKAASDAVSFVYQRVTGDAEISVRVGALSPAAALTGLMVRSMLDSGSPYLWLRTSPSGQRSVRRLLAEGLAATTRTLGSGGGPGWLKLVRNGALLSLFQSSNGTAWTFLATEAVDLPASIYVGIAVARGTALSATAFVDNVRIAAASANELPTISLTAPSLGKTVFEGDPLAISAVASDRDDRVEAVEFYVDGLRVGVDTTAPYVASWIATGVAVHQVSALARDSDGAIVRTSPVPVVVLPREGYDEGGGSTEPGPSQPSSTSGTPSGDTSGGTTGSTTRTWRLVFVPSRDHDRTVDRYTVEIFASTGWALVGSRDLGRPTVVAGEISVDITLLIRGLTRGQYHVIVRAVDDGATGRSEGALFVLVL